MPESPRAKARTKAPAKAPAKAKAKAKSRAGTLRALARIDLNLLVALQVLMEEKNVTRAARRLYITQPAMSKTLRRLRDLFADPLFTRAAHGLVPTPRAEELSLPLNTLLTRIESDILSGDFEPAEAEGEICITAPEFFAIGAIPRLLNKLQQEAPRLQIQSRNLLDNQEERLAGGSLDFSVHLRQRYPPEIVSHDLFTTKAVFWMRERHPLAGKKTLSARDLTKYPLIALHIPNIHDMELRNIRERLITSGIEGHPILRTSQLLTALETLTRTDGILMGPDFLGKFNFTEDHIVSKALPRGLVGPSIDDFTVPLCLIQHRRTLNSPLHTWLRELMLELFRR